MCGIFGGKSLEDCQIKSTLFVKQLILQAWVSFHTTTNLKYYNNIFEQLSSISLTIYFTYSFTVLTRVDSILRKLLTFSTKIVQKT